MALKRRPLLAGLAAMLFPATLPVDFVAAETPAGTGDGGQGKEPPADGASNTQKGLGNVAHDSALPDELQTIVTIGYDIDEQGRYNALRDPNDPSGLPIMFTNYFTGALQREIPANVDAFGMTFNMIKGGAPLTSEQRDSQKRAADEINAIMQKNGVAITRSQTIDTGVGLSHYVEAPAGPEQNKRIFTATAEVGRIAHQLRETSTAHEKVSPDKVIISAGMMTGNTPNPTLEFRDLGLARDLAQSSQGRDRMDSPSPARP